MAARLAEKVVIVFCKRHLCYERRRNARFASRQTKGEAIGVEEEEEGKSICDDDGGGGGGAGKRTPLVVHKFADCRSESKMTGEERASGAKLLSAG